jgi:hypothetical protein
LSLSPLFAIAAAEAAQDFVHARGAVDHLQQAFLLKVVHFVLAALGLDPAHRRPGDNEFGDRFIDHEQFEYGRPTGVTRALALGARYFLTLSVELGLGGGTVEAFDFFHREIQFLERGGIGFEGLAALLT